MWSISGDRARDTADEDGGALGTSAFQARGEIDEDVHATVRVPLSGVRRIDVVFCDGETVSHKIGRRRTGWVQVVCGCVEVNDEILSAGDAVTVGADTRIKARGEEGAILVIFDLPSP